MTWADLTEPVLASWLALPFTLAIAVIDLRHRIIPNVLSLLLLGLGLGLAVVRSPEAPVSAAALALLEGCGAFSALLGFQLAYTQLRGRVGLGLGDVKFVGAVTPMVGMAGLPTMILVASLTGLLATGLAILSGRRITATTRLPFGPFLVIGFHATLLIEAVAQ